MFDYIDNSASFKNSIHINAVGGTLVKNYKDSFFLRFHMKSDLAERLLTKEPTMCKRKEEYKNLYGEWLTKKIMEPVVVLQVMLCGNDEFLAEIMWKDDFDKMFEPMAESEDKK